MFFLLRIGFWLCIVLMLLPAGGTRPDAEPQVSAIDAVSAASAAVSDMRRFCNRQPGACEVGAQTAAALGHRAQAGAKLLYDILIDQTAQDAATPATPEITATIASGSVPLPLPRPMSPVATRPATQAIGIGQRQNTLTADDLAPVWRGPQRQAHLDSGA